MKITFEKIRWKNILSYGNNWNEFVFVEGLNTICGSNGEGKSSLIDILSFGLFGQPYRKIRIPELINRSNKKNLLVEVYFSRDRDKYIIRRGLKPNIFEINKNDSNVEMLSSKMLNQEEINKILGVTFDLFKQVIALSVNLTQPFLAMSTGERRNIIETVFNIEVFGEMNKIVKTNISDLSTSLYIKKSELDILESNLQTNEMSAKDFERMEKDWESNKKQNIDRIKGDINELKENIKVSEGNIKVGEKSLKKHIYKDVSEERKKLRSYNDKNVEKTYELNQLKDELKFLNENNVCPKCGQPLTEAHKSQKLADLTDRITTTKTEMDKLQGRMAALEKVINEEESKKNISDKINAAISREREKINHYNVSLEKKNNELELEKNSKKLKPTVDYKAEVLKSKNLINDCNIAINEINSDTKIQKALNQILSDSGIKRYFLKTFLPLLNERMNTRLADFNMPFKFNFDESMEANIIPAFGKHEVVSYNSCSEGEKKRLDMAVLLSFIEVIKIISNWDCNIIFFDELLDSAVDKANLDSIFDAIRNMVSKNEQCAYIISHRGLEQKKFDHQYLAEKVGRFSIIKEVI